MLQIRNLTITHRKDLRIILEKFNMALNDGDKAVIIGKEGTRNFSPLSGPVIRKMIDSFPGAVICISHDRKYIEEVCTKTYTLTEKGLM